MLCNRISQLVLLPMQESKSEILKENETKILDAAFIVAPFLPAIYGFV